MRQIFIFLFVLFFLFPAATGQAKDDPQVITAIIAGNWQEVIANAEKMAASDDAEERGLGNFLVYSTYLNMFDVPNAKKYFASVDSKTRHDAGKWIDKYINENPASGNLFVYRALSETNHIFIAKYMEKAIELSPSNLFPYLRLAIVYRLEGRNHDALGVLNDGLAKDPGNVTFMIVKSEIETEQGHYDEAIEILADAAKIQPQNSYIYFLLGINHTTDGNITKAIDSYSRSLSLNPNNITAHRNIGYLYFLRNYNDYALSHFEEVRKHHPNDPYILAMTGMLLTERKAFSQAETVLLSLLKIQPSNPVVHILLGDVYLNLKKLNIAEAEFSKAFRYDPENGYALYQLAIIDLGKNRTDAAFEKLRQSVRFDKRNSRAHYALGMIYYNHKNNIQAAIDSFKAAVAVDPEFKEARGRLELLRSSLVQETAK